MVKIKYRKQIPVYYYIFVLIGFSTIVIDALIPIISDQIKVGFDKISIALFFGSIASLVANYLSGRLSDRIEVKRIILFGLIFLFLSSILFIIYVNYITFIIIIFFLRVGTATTDTAIRSLSAKTFKKNLSKIFINIDITWYIGAFLGPLILSITLLYFDLQYRYIFIMMVVAYAISIIIFLFTDSKRGNSLIKKDNSVLNIKSFSIYRDPIVIIGSVIVFFYMGSFMGLSTWMTTYFLNFDLEVSYSSVILSLYWLFSIVGMIIATNIITRVKENLILLIGSILGTLNIVLFTFINNFIGKILTLAIVSISFSVIYPITLSICSRRNLKKSGTILGFTMALAYAGYIASQPVYGYITEIFGKKYIAFIAMVESLVGLVFVIILLKLLMGFPKKNDCVSQV